MKTVRQELLEFEQHAKAVLNAMPALLEADETLTGAAKLEAIQRIAQEYGLSF